MNGQAQVAARALAAVLLAEAAHLDGDDLDVISTAMSRIRGNARLLARALEVRGWGGGVLYGFGEPGKAEDLAVAEAEIQVMLDSGELSPSDLERVTDEPPTLPAGRRVTYQARTDYVVTDEVALRRYVRRRVDECDWLLDVEDLIVKNPFVLLAMVDGLETRDHSEAGLAIAGHRSIARTIHRSVWESVGEEDDDAFPTCRP